MKEFTCAACGDLCVSLETSDDRAIEEAKALWGMEDPMAEIAKGTAVLICTTCFTKLKKEIFN